jgi:hypothetical protein
MHFISGTVLLVVVVLTVQVSWQYMGADKSNALQILISYFSDIEGNLFPHIARDIFSENSYTPVFHRYSVIEESSH